MSLHDDLDDLNDDLSVIHGLDVDFLFSEDHSIDDLIFFELLILSSACR